MAEEQGREDLRSLLAEVCGNADFQILDCNVLGPKNEVNIKERFTCELRTTLDKEKGASLSEKCDNWRDKFAREVKCGFIYSEQKQGKQITFRKQYVCHLGHRNKTEGTNRDKKCQAKLVIKVLALKDNRQARWRDQKSGGFLSKGLETKITISFLHSHKVHHVEQYHLQRVSTETKVAFNTYFADGMSPSCAKAYHEKQIFLEYKEEERQEELADASSNPDYQQVKYLFKKWRDLKHGDRDPKNITKILRQKQAEYAQQGVTLHIQEEPLSVVVITPIMKRAHEKRFAGEVVFVDSSGSCDQSGSVVTFIFAASKIGGIPLAFIVHEDQTEMNYKTAFQAVREAVGSSGFGGKGEPSTIMTDDSLEERNGLKAAFPSAVLLLCIFHVCQAVWRWMCETKHGIPKENRQALMQLFREVLYAATEETCDEAVKKVHNSEIYKTNKSFEKYFNEYLQRRLEWCLFARKYSITRGHNTNNILEAAVRIFKDFILERCKAFNGSALVDFVVYDLELYHYRRIFSYLNLQKVKPDKLYRALLAKSSGLNIRMIDENLYKVTSGSKEGVEYNVDIEKEICDCLDGIGGKFCKHLCAIHTNEEVQLRNLPQMSDLDKADFLYIASGSLKNISFYQSEGLPEDHGEAFRTSDNPQSDPLPESTFVSGEEQPTDQFDASAHCSKEELRQEFSGMHSELDRLEDMLVSGEGHLERDRLVSAQRMKRKLKKVRNIAQFRDMCRGIYSNLHGRKIHVQPTSIARRVNRPGLTCGRRRIQGGRRSNFEKAKGLRLSNKRPHNLSKNIASNVPNAKSHSKGM